MVVLFDGKVMYKGSSLGSRESIIFLTSNEAKMLAANLEVAAEEADDHDAFELGLQSPKHSDTFTFHITGKNVKRVP